MKLLKLAIIALGLGFAGVAAAHSDEYLDTTKAPHGGQLRMAGMFHFELVIKPAAKGKINDVLVYVTDHAGTEIDTAGASGTATILSGGKTSVALTPDGKNVLKGAGNFKTGPNLKAVLSIGLPGKPAEQARFTPFAKMQAGEGHKH